MTLTDSHAGLTYKCLRGDMQLSRTMHDSLSEVFEARSRHGERRGNPSGRWSCPGCGIPMDDEHGHVRCGECGEYLDEFIHGLVELHPHLSRLLLTVEDTFEISGRGLVLGPFLPVDEARKQAFSVELHRPDGTIRWATALAQLPFIHPTPKKLEVHLLLIDARKDEVPVGTKIWIR